MNPLKTFCAAAFALCVSSAAYADELVYNWGAPNVVAEHSVGPGMKYKKVIYPYKPLTLWFVEIDLSNEYAKIEQAQSRNQVPDPLRWDVMTFYRENSRPGHQVKVAWNHDFFSYDSSVCIGLNVCEGEITWNKWGRSLLGITADGTAEVFYPSLDTRIAAQDGTSVEIDYYNALNGGIYGDCVFYNHLNSKQLSEPGTYITLRPLDPWTVNGEPVRCEVLSAGSQACQTSADGSVCVLYLRNAKEHLLDGHVNPGDIMTVTQNLRPDGWGIKPQRILNAFHGYPSIVHDGVLHDGEYNNFENGREYEKSSRVMAGISKDKTKLYIVTTEMSTTSIGVDCIELSAWLVEQGAWDVVNFDSGGSAAIVIDEKMLNVPGRSSVRPVQDAMLAISLAPEDKTTHHIAFSLKQLEPMIISRTPLRVLAFNQYDEILDEDLRGCTFECVPQALGYVDDEAVFHSSGQCLSGKIIARSKDGKIAELPVTTQEMTGIEALYKSFLVDHEQRMICGIRGTTPAGKVEVDAGALDWSVSPEGIVAVENGMLRGLANGNATISATFKGLTLDIDVCVEIPDAARQMSLLTCNDPASLKLTKTAAVKNLNYTTDNLPENWNGGFTMNFDLTTGRGSNITMTPALQLYSLPDSISLQMVDKDAIVDNITYTLLDAQGERITITATPDRANNCCTASFRDPKSTIEFQRYPLTLRTIKAYLINKSVPGTQLSFGSLNAFYPGYSSAVHGVLADDAPTMTATMRGEMLHVEFSASQSSAGRLCVYNVAGIAVAAADVECHAGANKLSLNLKDLPSGIYIVTLRTHDRPRSCKLILR